MASARCGKRPGCGAHLDRAARPLPMGLSRPCGHLMHAVVGTTCRTRRVRLSPPIVGTQEVTHRGGGGEAFVSLASDTRFRMRARREEDAPAGREAWERSPHFPT